ncbi:Integral membrane protein SED5 [Mycoemilia scoparia]|uniref:Integral membrane protein SED5 n=1 Tax=Mycoemilia scoparia TaxID=417184 RepID=A0A9W8A886_9FUNG|nr:Integral membrane protein SED5 [Mycoemilia scoparia]
MTTTTRTKNLRNRTDEFRSLTNVLRKRQAKSQNLKIDDPKNMRAKHSLFASQAGEIGGEIQQVTQELEQLALLARRKTLFDDKSAEIANLTNNVKERIAVINSKISALQKSTAQNTNTNGRHVAEHNANVVMSLQSQLATTSTAFKDVLEIRSQNLKATSDRRDQLMIPKNESKFMASGSPLYRSRPSRNSRQPDYNDNEDFVALSMPENNESQAQQMMLLDQQENYLDSRSEAIRSVESTISELGQIFQQLAHMVSEQREVIQRIDANVEDIDMNVQGAQQELLHYFSNISSNRWLIMKVFAIILFAVFIFVLML